MFMESWTDWLGLWLVVAGILGVGAARLIFAGNKQERRSGKDRRQPSMEQDAFDGIQRVREAHERRSARPCCTYECNQGRDCVKRSNQQSS